MEEKFQKYTSDQHQLVPTGCTLIAASAGVDSTVLCHLFKRAGWSITVAHCNFQLREVESEKDEYFVKQLAGELSAPFFSTRFDTQEYAEQNKLGIQEAARELRYEWLKKIAQNAGCQQIATAHHLDDNIETVLFNFAKGTGIRGVRGILTRRDNIIRPLLFATKNEILAFAQQEKIEYREDASNSTDKYSRNKIRLHVVPALEEVVPGFKKNAGATISRLVEAEKLIGYAVEKIRSEVVESHSGLVKIDLKKLQHYPATPTVMFELLRPFGFSESQVQNILQTPVNQSGRIFFSANFKAAVTQFHVLIKEQEKAGGVLILIDKDLRTVHFQDGRLTLEQTAGPPANFPKNPMVAWLDCSALTWPLTLRHWQPGDAFQPIGMGGKHKKLQDFFTDNKLSIFEKEAVWVLVSSGEICWVVGMRADERFKVLPATIDCLNLVFYPEMGETSQ